MIADSEPNAKEAARRALLAQVLRGEVKAPMRARIPRRPREDRAPLTAGQRQLWLLSQMAGDSPVYNEAVTIRIPERLDVDALRRALDELLRRQEAWRTTFPVEEGEPEQVIHSDQTVPLRTVDLRELPDKSRLSEALKLAQEDACRPFDLASSLPIRALLVSVAEDNHLLFLTIHHIVFDGVTVHDVLMPQLDALYHAFAAGLPATGGDPEVRYGDYAQWLAPQIDGEETLGQLSYWEQQLAGDLPKLTLPETRQSPNLTSYRGATRYQHLGKTLSDQVKQFSMAAGVTPFMTLFAAYALLLRRFSGQDDLIVGTVVSTRSRSDLEGLAGHFLNTLPLRIDLSGDLTIGELLQRSRTAVLGAFEHQSVPFDMIVKRVRPDRRAGKTPLVQAVMTLEPPATPMESGWTASRMDVDTGTAKFDLGLYFSEDQDGIIGRFEYSVDLFAERTIVQMVEHFQLMLTAMTKDAASRISQLPALTDEEEKLLRAWNDTDVPLPPSIRFFEPIAERAAETPDAIALSDSAATLTYADLQRRSNQLAHFLRARGVGAGTPVAVHLDRSVDLVVALLGILKAGAAYVPLDSSYPAERIDYVLRDSGVSTIVTDEHTLASLPPIDISAVCIDVDRAAIDGQPDGPLDSEDQADRPAYIIYTSGSTGKPKGVVVTHRNVINLLAAVQRRIQMTAQDIMLAVTSPSFDISVTEFFLPLITGGRVVIADRETVIDPRALLELLDQSGATFMQATPATWRAIVESEWPPRRPVTLLTAGEALTTELAARMLAGATAVWNLYGPTETTIYSTAHCVTREDNPIPIGRPIDNTRTYILDRDRRPVPPGVSGELYIGGAGVSAGYLGRPELTAERFTIDPLDSDASGPIYRTGDVCFWRADGIIDYLGRADHQVKVRGYRIELGEVESALRRQTGVEDAIVITSTDAAGETQLLAFVTAAVNTPLTGRDVRQVLQAAVPAYMVPARITVLESFPLTPNGKVDRRAIQSMPLDVEASTSTPPRTLAEGRLAAIWSELLGVNAVGIEDDFFELGGHSLLAVRLLERMRIEFGHTVSLNTLFTSPTIEAMVRALEAPEVNGSGSLISALRTSGHRRPFFMLHGQPKGRGLYSLKLARALDTEQPFYVLQPHALVGLPVPATIEEMAADYIAAMKVHQPHGPYRLGGFCTSGIIAYEIAQRLTAAGEEVEMLILLHTRLPRFVRSGPIRKVFDLTGTLVGAPEQTRMEWYSRLLDAQLYTLRAIRRRRPAWSAQQASSPVPNGDGDLPEPIVSADGIPTGARHRGMDPYHWALGTYTFRPYFGQVTLLRSAKECHDDLMSGWGRLVANIEAFDVPPHVTVLREEVDDLSRSLNYVLAR